MTELVKSLADQITARLSACENELKIQWNSDFPFRYFVVDDLLPDTIASQIKPNLPADTKWIYRSNLRERKRVGIDFRNAHPLLQASLFAFQAPEVLAAIERITGMKQLQADPTLYASGISVMGKGDYLNPHLDNSHDGDGKLYRTLNLLFYVSPDWKKENGGNFEVWDPDVLHPTEIVAKYNRLVVMETHDFSWHSVNKVLVDDTRCCVSNYYFGPMPVRGRAFKHVTTFTGRPEHKMRRLALDADGIARNFAKKILPKRDNSKHRLDKKEGI